ncbi:hypothetical protein ASE19_18445 [Nocardioides sp. Root79]|nr:hypothetical protein ASE19_18445 [Nocardioides sp. Root79]KRC75293.1 hypothetical protein ASE20_20345 [Nocardioides sp. Root240]
MGDHDLFRDEDLAYAHLLLASGSLVELHLCAGAYHAFDLFALASAVPQSFTGSWYCYLGRHFGAAAIERIDEPSEPSEPSAET